MHSELENRLKCIQWRCFIRHRKNALTFLGDESLVGDLEVEGLGDLLDLLLGLRLAGLGLLLFGLWTGLRLLFGLRPGLLFGLRTGLRLRFRSGLLLLLRLRERLLRSLGLPFLLAGLELPLRGLGLRPRGLFEFLLDLRLLDIEVSFSSSESSSLWTLPFNLGDGDLALSWSLWSLEGLFGSGTSFPRSSTHTITFFHLLLVGRHQGDLLTGPLGRAMGTRLIICLILGPLSAVEVVATEEPFSVLLLPLFPCKRYWAG